MIASSFGVAMAFEKTGVAQIIAHDLVRQLSSTLCGLMSRTLTRTHTPHARRSPSSLRRVSSGSSTASIYRQRSSRRCSTTPRRLR
jgi:hypothetical protein